jgi:hypothetical protein
MSASAELRVVHVASGRVRVCRPQACAAGEQEVRQLLASIPGAQAVRANGLTQNVLVQFDERLTTANRVLDDLRQAAATLTSRDTRGGRSRPRAPCGRRVRRCTGLRMSLMFSAPGGRRRHENVVSQSWIRKRT